MSSEKTDYTPLAKCRVLYLGSSQIKPADGVVKTSDLQNILRARYVPNVNADVQGVDTWLTVLSAGFQIQYVDEADQVLWYPIQTLSFCAAVKLSEYATKGGAPEFLPIDHPQLQSRHPPIFCLAIRRANSTRDTVCSLFVCKSDKAAMALVKSSNHAYKNTSGWLENVPVNVLQEELVPMRSKPENRRHIAPQLQSRPPLPPGGANMIADHAALARGRPMPHQQMRSNTQPANHRPAVRTDVAEMHGYYNGGEPRGHIDYQPFPKIPRPVVTNGAEQGQLMIPGSPRSRPRHQSPQRYVNGDVRPHNGQRHVSPQRHSRHERYSKEPRHESPHRRKHHDAQRITKRESKNNRDWYRDHGERVDNEHLRRSPSKRYDQIRQDDVIVAPPKYNNYPPHEFIIPERVPLYYQANLRG